MKKILLASALGLFGMANAQLKQGNWMVGSSVTNMKFTNGLNIQLTPKAGYFIADRFVVGAGVDLSVTKTNNSDKVQTNWGVAPFARYYFTSTEIDSMLKNGAFFAEGSAGFAGSNADGGKTTNGVGLGIGAGYAYFITNNVSLEGMLKLGTTVGGGNTTGNADVSLGVGFNIYLPTKAVKNAARDAQ